jgi:hypothetical protein
MVVTVTLLHAVRHTDGNLLILARQVLLSHNYNERYIPISSYLRDARVQQPATSSHSSASAA